MRTRTLERCFCGRIGVVRRTVIDGTAFVAPLCHEPGGRCAELSAEEREDPAFRAWFAKGYSPDKLDLGIRDRVEVCRAKGWETLFSCDGHGLASAYIVFWSESDATLAKDFFAEHEGERRSSLQPFRSPLMGSCTKLVLSVPLRWAVRISVHFRQDATEAMTQQAAQAVGPRGHVKLFWQMDGLKRYRLNGQVNDRQTLDLLSTLEGVERVSVKSPVWWAPSASPHPLAAP